MLRGTWFYTLNRTAWFQLTIAVCWKGAFKRLPRLALKASGLGFLSAGVTGVWHHAWLKPSFPNLSALYSLKYRIVLYLDRTFSFKVQILYLCPLIFV